MAKKKKDGRGGKREGAGRKIKFEGDSIISLGVYPRKSHVELIGRPKAKEVAIAAIEAEFLKQSLDVQD